MNDNGGATVAKERVGAIAQGYVFVFKRDVGLTCRADDNVLHVAGVVAVGILQSMLLVFRIEVRAGRLEVGSFALGVLMKVNAVLARRKVMQLNLEPNPCALLPQNNRADRFALSVFEFDFSFGGAWERADGQDCNNRDGGKSWIFHAEIISNFSDESVHGHERAMA